jgi:prepilin-type processing-associated H-X9-DG protein
MRKLCKECNERPTAINYYKEGKPYYRSKCDHCSKSRKGQRPLWALAGYKKKLVCEKCNYASKHTEQFNVLYVDGNLQNNRYTNLKTVCANCQRILQKEGVKWKQGDLRPDF